MQLHECLTNWRQDRGLSVDDLAVLSNVPKSTLAKILSGNTPNPQIETLKAIVYALGHTLDEIEDEQRYQYTRQEREMILKYRSLDPQGQSIIKALLDMEAGRTEAIRAQIWREVEERGYRIEAAREEQAEA